MATALRDNEQHGIWGGTTPVERKQALRQSRDVNTALSYLLMIAKEKAG